MGPGVPVFCFCCIYSCIPMSSHTCKDHTWPTTDATSNSWSLDIILSLILVYTNLCVSLPSSPLRSPQTRSPRLRTCLG